VERLRRMLSAAQTAGAPGMAEEEGLAMGLRRFGSSIALAFGFLAVGLVSTPAYADDPTVSIVGCFVAGGVSVPAGSSVTFKGGWAMATRGNTQAFANAATGVMTVDGLAVTPTKSEVFPLPVDSEPLDGWRVSWSYTTTAPAAGQIMVVTFTIVLARDVADHEGGIGKPSILPAGQMFPPFSCTVTGF